MSSTKAATKKEKGTNKGPKILIVEKSGEIKEVHYLGADLSEATSAALAEISKKAGHKNPEGFDHVETWNLPLQGQDYSIRLYGKIRGRANYENKYEFPPPVDTLLLFGSCVLIRHDAQTNQIVSLSAKEWSNIYEYLYGGFDDLERDEDDDDDDEDDNEEDDGIEEKTKSGYKKDGFVIDDDENENENENENEDGASDEDECDDDDDGAGDEDEQRTTTASSHKKSSRKVTSTTTKKTTIDYYNCDNELCEEAYIE
jgi:hypothetical protein